MQHAKENQSEQIRWDVKVNALMSKTNNDISGRDSDESTKYLDSLSLSFTSCKPTQNFTTVVMLL